MAEESQFAIRNAEGALTMAGERLKKELTINPRVLMSTIGSYHKMPVQEVDVDDDEDSFSQKFAAINVVGENKRRKTIVIFDEAGCIPKYEFLGLSRLGRDIEGLVCVGDKNQLPPYNPSFTRKSSQKTMYGFEKNVGCEKIKSLLDASKFTKDSGVIKLTMQYRVPRDIATILNHRIYQGDYKTAPECAAPLAGFHFVDVFDSGQNREKYVNDNEIEECILLARNSLMDGFEKNIMVLTPISFYVIPSQLKMMKNLALQTHRLLYAHPVQKTAA
mmetsp:Transcript_19122/g.27193  ORF Transcript_19122/g.27193 Transcript_19122/m.27193 type:complete len:275 (-) Transcript_19122:473-1297(-)